MKTVPGTKHVPPKQRALVTGASRGIGAAIAKRLAADDFHVILNFTTNIDRASAILKEIVSAGGTGELSQFDVANPTEVDEKIDALGKLGARRSRRGGLGTRNLLSRRSALPPRSHRLGARPA